MIPEDPKTPKTPKTMKTACKFLSLLLFTALLFIGNLYIGGVHLPWRDVTHALLGTGEISTTIEYIVLEMRLMEAITALLGGAALAVSGLLLQTAFRNPLAGPSILGINSGASLGVALVMLLMGGAVTLGAHVISGYLAVMLGAFIGSLAVMALLLMLSTIVHNDLLLLIAGVMLGYLASSVVMLLNFTATAEGVQSYVMWGMGTFGGVSSSRMPLFSIVTLVGLFLSLLLIKPLNLLLLGDRYAQNLGLSLRRTRNHLLIATGLLVAVVTAYCGPIAFIGLAVPHMARWVWRTDQHAVLMPGVMLVGADVALSCSLVSQLPAHGAIPINALTPVIGAPVIIYVIIRNRH